MFQASRKPPERATFNACVSKGERVMRIILNGHDTGMRFGMAKGDSMVEAQIKSLRDARRRDELVADRRLDNTRVRFMAEADGYVMVRKPHCVPFIMQTSEWLRLPRLDGAPHPREGF
jgi:hypothetical protein